MGLLEFVHLSTVRAKYLRKIGSILGLCAILLTVFVPLISQSLRSHDALDIALSSFCSSHGLTQNGPTNDDPATHTLHGDACVYCGFCAHFPGVTTAAVTAAPLAVSPVLPPALPDVAFRPADLGNWAQPRGPPLPLVLV